MKQIGNCLMKLILKAVTVFLCLNTVGYGSEFTQEKYNGMESHNFGDNNLKTTYKKIMEKDLSYPEEAVREFRLSSGVDVQVTAKSLSRLTWIIPPKLEGVILGEEYQQYQISENNQETIGLRHLYGASLGSSKFCSDNREALIHALLNPGLRPLTEDKIYQITITNYYVTDETRFFIENILMGHSSDLIIRYLHPQYNGVDHGVFIPNKNDYNLNYGSEKLLAEFKVEQIPRFSNHDDVGKN